jgi:hypothetical protein
MRQMFWTRFGQYMRPLKGAEGHEVNWLNYKTGIKHIYFRMDADKESATIAIELHHPDQEQQEAFFERIQALKGMLESATGERWDWQPLLREDRGKIISRIGTQLDNVNVLREEDWPVIISFLKPRIIALDFFWNQAKDIIE